MDKLNFQNRINDILKKKPKLFALDADAKVDVETIKAVEKYYKVVFPKSYKEFINLYGGGYFGFIVVYSCDCDGMFYIKDNVLKEWVEKKSFLPVIDFETGDFLGFEIIAGKCKSSVAIYSHEEDKLREIDMDFYEALLLFGLHVTDEFI